MILHKLISLQTATLSIILNLTLIKQFQERTSLHSLFTKRIARQAQIIKNVIVFATIFDKRQTCKCHDGV